MSVPSLWVVQMNEEEIVKALETVAALVARYYRLLLDATGNHQVAMTLAVEYQKVLFGVATAKREERP